LPAHDGEVDAEEGEGQEISIETYFPADDATSKLMRSLANAPAA
jgi:hypothetical protein